MSRHPAGIVRVIHVETNEDGTTGGSYRALADLVRGLDRNRFQPSVLFYSPTSVADFLARDGIPVTIWEEHRVRERRYIGPQSPWRRTLGLARAFRLRVRFLRESGASLLHLNNSPGVGFEDWLPAARWLGIPCVAHLRGPLIRPSGAISRRLQDEFDRVLPVSRWVLEDAASKGLPRRRMRLVHDGVDVRAVRASVRRSREEVRRQLGISEQAFLLVLAGHLRPWKGQNVAIEALGNLPPGLRDRTHLLLVGAETSSDRAFLDLLGRQIEAASLGRRVRFLGHRSDVPELMNASDVVLHTSVEPEPFGLVVVEAMALGCAVVASDLGGPREVLGDGAGLRFNPTQPGLLSALLERLAEDPVWRRSLGESARKRAEDFDVTRTIHGVSAAFEEALRGSRPHSPEGPEPQ